MRTPGELPSRAAESRFLSIVRADVDERRDPEDREIGVHRRLTAHSEISLCAQRSGGQDVQTLGVAFAVQYGF